jgi:hypothetical protein
VVNIEIERRKENRRGINMVVRSKMNCKVCDKEFEYLLSQRRNPTFCSKVCQLKFMRNSQNSQTVENKPTISTSPPKSKSLLRQIFPWL